MIYLYLIVCRPKVETLICCGKLPITLPVKATQPSVAHNELITIEAFNVIGIWSDKII